jgi:hypothetical protein
MSNRLHDRADRLDALLPSAVMHGSDSASLRPPYAKRHLENCCLGVRMPR